MIVYDYQVDSDFDYNNKKKDLIERWISLIVWDSFDVATHPI